MCQQMTAKGPISSLPDFVSKILSEQGMLIHLGIVCGQLFTTMTKCIVVRENMEPEKPKIFTYTHK